MEKKNINHKVSIVIPVFNQHEMTKECLISIVNNTYKINGLDYEIIIVDNGSTPVFEITEQEKQYLIYRDINRFISKTIRNESNLGFTAAVNQGIRAATGDIICLLNNDTVLTPYWLNRLIGAIDDGFDIVSPMTNYVAGLQRAHISVYEDQESLNDAAYEFYEQNQDVVQPVNFVIGFCMAFKKSLFEKIGEFDESMFPTSGEEIDFCYRCRKAGGNVGIVKDVYIHHYGSQTFQDMQNAGILNYDEICKSCNAHLAKKYGENFWQDQGNVNINLDIYENNEKTYENNTDKIRLNLGCGQYKLAGFTNIDQFAEVNPDVVDDILNLPYQQNSVDEIYCGHVLEHFTLIEGLQALRYWHSLLKPNGIITVTVPNFDALIAEYITLPKEERIEHLQTLNDVFIYSYCQRSHHKYCYNGELLSYAMHRAGFTDLEKLPQNHHYFTEPVKWQVAYQGKKGGDR